ncbi:GTPase [Planctomycetota bacterium]
MGCRAAVLTGKGTSALATVMVAGDTAATLLCQLLHPTPIPEPGQVNLCNWVTQTGTIDQVTLGRETPDCFAIHCHGNPLIVEQIMEHLRHAGAELLEAEAWTFLFQKQQQASLIEVEIAMAQAQTKTLLGARLLEKQKNYGLLPWVKSWQQQIPTLETLRTTAAEVLKRSTSARYSIHGCKVALIGPPNSGKSTLFNCLLGRDKALVTDIEGTTRDYLDAELTLDDLHLHLIDTAGLDTALLQQHNGHLDRAAQEQTAQQLEEADLVLLTLDGSRSPAQLERLPLDILSPLRTIAVINKSDLPQELTELPTERFMTTLHLSALHDTGMTELFGALRSFCGVTDLNIAQPAVFTLRQHDILERLQECHERSQAESLIHGLLQGSP